MKCFLLSLFFPLFLLAEIPYGIVGIEDGNSPNIYFIDSLGNATPVPSLPSSGFDLLNLAINASGKAIFVGSLGSSSQAYFISPSGVATLALNLADTYSGYCKINNSGAAIVGSINSARATAQLISASGTVTEVTGISTAMRPTSGVAIDNNGNGLISIVSGVTSAPPAYQVSSSGVATPVANLPSVTAGTGNVCITPSGLGCLNYGGSGVKTRYIVNGTAVAPAFPPSGAFNIYTDSPIALNDFGHGILAGDGASGPVLCTFSLTGPKIQTTIPNPNAYIGSVDINNSSVGIAVGSDFGGIGPVAYFLSPEGSLVPINTLPSNIYTTQACINDDNVALISGQDSNSYGVFYLVSYPTGAITPVSVPSGIAGSQFFCALTPPATPTPSPSVFFIPTTHLTSNDLKLANYINSYAPSLTSYFIFSNLNQTLPQALQSVAPTRNSFALFSASNTVFSYNYVLSNHSRNNRASYRPFPKEISEEFVTAFFAKKAVPIEEESTPEIPFIEKPKPLFEMWGQFIGTFAYQKAEGQSPSYDPKTGGFVVGFDHKMGDWCLGIGSAYSYTHVSEGNAGKIHLNQESLFFYSLWNAHCFYIDTALWGGSFQTSSLRKIQMTGYQFQAKSDIWAWQLSPHLEVGYDRSSETKQITIEPYAMFDWVNNWQLRYKERGSGPFNMGQDNHYSSFLRTELGFRLYEQIDFAHWHLIIQEKGGFVNKKPFQVGTVNAYLIGFPGSFTVETFTTTQNLGVAELELLFVPTNPYFPYGTLSYQGEFGKMYQSHTASLNATWNF